MEIGIVELGRTGAHIALRRARGGAQVIACDVSTVAQTNLEREPAQ